MYRAREAIEDTEGGPCKESPQHPATIALLDRLAQGLQENPAVYRRICAEIWAAVQQARSTPNGSVPLSLDGVRAALA